MREALERLGSPLAVPDIELEEEPDPPELPAPSPAALKLVTDLPAEMLEGATPAVRLRKVLAAARAAGLTFDEAWPGAVETVVAGLPAGRRPWHPRPAWQSVFLALEDRWRAGYERQHVMRLTPDLMDVDKAA